MVNFYNIKAIDATDVTEPVTLEDAKAFMKVDYSDDDAVITAMIKSARKIIARKLNRVLVPSTVTLTVQTSNAYEPVGLYYDSNIADLIVTDLEADSLPLSADEYKMLNSTLTFNYKGAYRLTWTETPQVEDDIKEAIKMLVAYRYNNRGDQEKQTGIPEDIQAIIDLNAVIAL